MHLQRLEISRSAYLHNLAQIRAIVGPKVGIMAVVKADAYGHGLDIIAPLAVAGGADALGVNCLQEAARIRSLGITRPVVVLGYTPLDELSRLLELGAEPVLYNPESLRRYDGEAARAGCQAPFHLKLETGVHRQGVTEADLDTVLALVKHLDHAELKACSMHFANIEDTTDHSYAYRQLDTLQHMMERVEAVLGVRPAVHTACSAAAAILMPETHFQMVRLGISGYGLWPSKETYLSNILLKKNPPVFRPVMTWKTLVAQVKDIPADSAVGYGCSFRATRALRMAVLPVGYYDGYDRSLSNQASVLVRGKRAPLLGRICMNMTMVDVTDIPGVSLEDEVVLLGAQGRERITAEEMGVLANTIHYEIIARIPAHVPRVEVE